MKTPLALLESGSSSLPLVPAPCHPWQFHEWASNLPFAEIVQADAALRAWIETGAWPTLTPPLLAQIHMRLEAAMDILADPRYLQAATGQSRKQILRMALVDFWRDNGLRWIEMRYPPHKPGSE